MDDLRALHRTIAIESRVYADRYVRRIQEDARRLNRFPASGRVVPEYEIMALRELIIGNHRLIYQWDAYTNQVYVLMLLHGHQQMPPVDLV